MKTERLLHFRGMAGGFLECWLAGPLDGWLVALLTGESPGRLAVKLSERLFGGPADWWVSGRPAGRLSGGLADGAAEWWASGTWLVSPLEGWMVGSADWWVLGRLAGRLSERLFGGPADWWASGGRLVGPFKSWLVGLCKAGW